MPIKAFVERKDAEAKYRELAEKYGVAPHVLVAHLLQLLAVDEPTLLENLLDENEVVETDVRFMTSKSQSVVIDGRSHPLSVICVLRHYLSYSDWSTDTLQDLCKMYDMSYNTMLRAAKQCYEYGYLLKLGVPKGVRGSVKYKLTPRGRVIATTLRNMNSANAMYIAVIQRKNAS